MGRPFIDLTGQRFGKLTVISYAGTNASHNRVWNCLCDCGTNKAIEGRRLASGTTLSCRCLGLSKLKGGHNRLQPGIARFHDLFRLYHTNAAKRGYEFSLNKEQFYDLTQKNCHYCDLPPAQKIRAGKECNGDFTYNGIDRIDNSLGYTLANARSCCKQCNVAKSTLSEQEFYNWLQRVASQMVNNSDRLIAAYEAARQARFQRGGGR